MKPCKDYLELISARVDGALTPDEARRLGEHLASCEACRRELAGQEILWERMASLPEAQVPEGLAERTFARATKRRHMPRWAWGVSATAAAAVLIAVLVGIKVMRTEKPLDPETQQVVKEIDVLQNLDVLQHLDTYEALGDGVIMMSEDASKAGGAL